MSHGEELFTPKGKAGRKQTVVAEAWISRKNRKAVFHSNVNLGDGRVFKLSTKFYRRELALVFCKLHLIHHLNKGDVPFDPPPPQAVLEQSLLFNLPPSPPP